MAAVVNPFTARWIMEPKPQNVWGVPHSLWFFAMGVGGALFINRALFGLGVGRLLGMSLADLLSLLFIGIGGLILIADLGKPFRLLRALANPRTSWISVGAICDFVFLGLDGLWTIAELDLGGARPLAGLPWAGNSPLGVAFQVVAGVAALVVIAYPGLVLAYSPSIPFWNTTLIPLQFLAYAFSSAVGLVLLATLWAPLSLAQVQMLASLQGLLLAGCLLLLVAHLLNGSYSHTVARLSVERLLQGDQQRLFLWGALLAGLGLPLFLTLWGAATGAGPAVLALAALLILLGNWLSKLTIIKAGTYAPYL